MKTNKNELGIGEDKTTAGWKFSEDIVNDFDDHIERSVPRYVDCHRLTVRLSDFFLTEDNSKYLDIGSTTGSLVEKIAKHHSKKHQLDIKGIEIEEHFINFAKARLKGSSHGHKISFVNNDLTNLKFANGSKFDFVTSLFTLQFIKPSHRAKILEKIYESLNWGGGFIFFEKVRGTDARFQDILNYLLNLEKIDQNFKPTEIYGKSMSLIGAMEPFSNAGNLQILNAAGFTDIEVVFRHINFQGYLCIK